MSVRGLGVLVCLAAGIGQAADVRVIEQIVAKVNGEIITESELERSRMLIEGELRQRGLTGRQLAEERALREKHLLRDRIDELLIVQRAKELDINVDAEVARRLGEIQRQAKIADQDKFHEYIRQQSGLSFEDLRQEMREQFMRERLIRQEIGSRVNVPRAEVEKYYKENQSAFVREDRVLLSEILISTVGKSDQETAALEKKAKDLVERARRGERFTDLARDNSDADSAEGDGRLRFFARNELTQQIADLVFAQDRGYVTDPIRVPNGFLILRVDQKHTAGLASLEEVENEIMQKLAEPLVEPAIRAFLTRLRADAFLEIREGYEDSAPAPGKDTTWMVHAQLKPETVTKEEVISRRYRPRLLWVIPMWYERTAGGD